MASVTLKIRPGRPNAAGRFPIFVSVIHNGAARFIPTPFDVADPAHFSNGRIIARGASETNKHLSFILDDYRGKLARLDLSAISTAAELKEALTVKPSTRPPVKPLTISEMFAKRIEQMEAQGRASYASMLRYSARVIAGLMEDKPVQALTRQDIRALVDSMRAKGCAPGQMQMRLTHYKAALNDLIDREAVRFDVHPFKGITIPQARPKYTDISRADFLRLVNYKPSNKMEETAKNAFLLSFYLCGINLADLTRLGDELRGQVLRFERQKTRDHTRGGAVTSFTIPPEARPLIEWAERAGLFKERTDTQYKTLQRAINRGLTEIAERVGIRGSFSYYSARHTWAEFAFLSGIPSEIVGYCLGHSTSAGGRAVFNYIRVLQAQADDAIDKVRTFIS